MKTSSTALLTQLLALSVTVTSRALMRRQASCIDISKYFKQVTTALFAVNYLQNFVHPCDQDLISYFDAQGLDGQYAVDLICVYDGGSPIFNETLGVVNSDILVSWIGLFAAQYSIDTPARNVSCDYVNTETLDELELDSTAIKKIICDFSPCTNATSTSSIASASSTGSSSCSTTSTGSITSKPPTSSNTGSITGSATIPVSGSSITPPSISSSISGGPVSSSSSISNTASISSISTASVTTGNTSSVSGSSSSATGSISGSGSSVSVTSSSASSSITSLSSGGSGSITASASSVSSSGPPSLQSSITYYKS